ncbi:MAG: hypothetical protein QXL17_06155 [Candidatus Thermoplasmatota archaeon]
MTIITKKNSVSYVETNHGTLTVYCGDTCFKTSYTLLPAVLFRLPGTVFRIKRMAKRGGTLFHQELINQGLDKEIADKLTATYLETSHVKTYLEFFK